MDGPPPAEAAPSAEAVGPAAIAMEGAGSTTRLAFSTRFAADQESVLKLASLPAALAKELSFMDSDGSGDIDVYELRKLAKLYKKDALSLRRAIGFAVGLAVLLLLTLFSMLGLTSWAVALQKDMRVSSSHALTALDGSVVRTASEDFSISAAGELIHSNYLAASPQGAAAAAGARRRRLSGDATNETEDGEASDAAPLVTLAIATTTVPLSSTITDEQLFALRSVALANEGKTLILDVAGSFRDADGSFAIATHLGTLRVRGDTIFFMEDGLSPIIHDLGFSLDSAAVVNGARARRLVVTTTASVTVATSTSTCIDFNNQCCGGKSREMVNGVMACKLCVAGRYKINKNNDFACNACPAGAYCLEGSIYPTDCPMGSYNGEERASACTKCPAGTFLPTRAATSASLCTPCAAGKYSDEGASACTLCAAGTFSLQGNATCTACQTDPYYEWCAAGGAACQQCAAGSYILFAKNYTYTLDSVTLSSYGVTSTSRSIQLPDMSSGASGCAACRPGTYSSYMGSAACDSCPLGTFSNRSGAANESACLPCTFPNVTLAPGSTSCVKCRPGDLPLPDLTGCSGCPAGQFTNQSVTTSLVCANCTAGFFSPRSGATSCTISPAGFIAPYAMNSEVIRCPIATFSSAGSVNCTACAWGYVAAQNSSACAACGAGSRALDDRSACTPCSAGSFSNASLNTECLLAPPGFFVATSGARAPTPCARGSYMPTPGALRCALCAAGTFSPTNGSTSCTQCAPGSWSAANASSCRVALPGYFVPSSLDSAQPCAAGTFANASGASNCTVCPVGSILGARIASPNCTACKLNTYFSYSNITACLPW